MNDDDFIENSLDTNELNKDNFENNDKKLNQDFKKDLDDHNNL